MKKHLICSAAFVFMVLFVCSCSGQAGQQTINNDIAPQQDSLFRLNMVFVGDIMGHDGQINAAYQPSTKTYDYVDNYEFVAPIIKSFDLAFCNLEVTLPGKPPYAGYPNFRSPDAIALALKEAGFDVVVTANNHSNDGFGKALSHTIDTLRGLGFYQTGTFKNQAERDSLYPLLIEKNGFNLAILNYTYGTNGIKDTPPTIVNMIDTALIRKDIVSAHSKNPDLLIAVMHWGDEYQLIENRYQRQLADFLASLDVDIIIGSHPHVIQPVRYVKKPDGDSIVCVYSMGNYISNQNQPNTDGGIMFEVGFTKHKKSGEVKLDTFYHHLIWRYRAPSNEQPGKKFQVIPINAYEKGLLFPFVLSDTDKAKMDDFSKRMRVHIQTNSVSVENNEPDRFFKSPETALYYHVQLLAVQKPVPADTFANLKIQIEEKQEQGIVRYISIGYLQKEEAVKALEQVKSSGFPDAFIVSYINGERQ